MADQGKAPAGDGSGGDNENFTFLVLAMMWIPAGLLIESLRPFAIMGFFFLLIHLGSSYKPQGGADGGKKKEDPGNEPESP